MTTKSDTPIHSSVSEQFRGLAGLPPRQGDGVENDPLEPKELQRFPEPEGGFGGRGETEVDERHGKVDEDLVEELQEGEERSAKSGQGATDGVDASTSTEATEAEMEAADKSGGSDKGSSKATSSKEKTPAAKKTGSAKKTAAKKTAAKK